MNVSVILAGGSGQRFESTKPKQYHTLNEKEIIAYAYESVARSALTDKTIIVSNCILCYEAEYAKAGITHNLSVKSAIDYIIRDYPQCRKTVFVDSVRPFISSNIIDRYYEFLDNYDAVITAQHITDSLGKNGEQFIDRADYFLIQKPEAFRFPILSEYFNADSPKTAIVQQLPPGARIFNYFGFEQNMKITYPQDLIVAKAIMDRQDVFSKGVST